jgi:hypothetical protein
MSGRLIIRFGAPISIVLAALAVSLVIGAKAQQAAAIQEISIPSEWVAFQANVSKSGLGGKVVHGRFYRNQDGSERLETGPTISDIRVIDIKNVSKSKHYLFTAASRSWRVDPMLLPPSGYKPPRVKLPSAFFKPYPFRLALARGQDGSLTAREGL